MTGRSPGWYPDPTGRFGHRWYDGTDWDDNVIGANGQPMLDPYPRADAALRRPTLPVVPERAAASVGQRWTPTVSEVASAATDEAVSEARATPGAVPIVIAAAGFVTVLASLLVLDWADGVGFLDARDTAARIGGNVADTVLRISLQIGSFVAVLAAALTSVGALRTTSSSMPTVAAGAAGLGAVLHTFTIVRLFRLAGPGPELGAWVGTVGWFAVIAGLALAVVRRRT